LKENGNISEFEQALITKMRFHRKVTVEHLAGIYGVHYTSISRYITKWAPRWGDIGLDLSILHLTPEYLKKSCPKEFRDSGMQNVAALVDGKVFKTEDCRKNSAIKRAMYSDKVHHPGVLKHTWTTPSGLTFDHSIKAKVAIKKVPKAFEDLIDAKRIVREIKLLKFFDHENIIGLVDVQKPPSKTGYEDIYIITDLMETDMHRVIYSR
jgi:serine/threonine protein kinase